MTHPCDSQNAWQRHPIAWLFLYCSWLSRNDNIGFSSIFWTTLKVKDLVDSIVTIWCCLNTHFSQNIFLLLLLFLSSSSTFSWHLSLLLTQFWYIRTSHWKNANKVIWKFLIPPSYSMPRFHNQLLMFYFRFWLWFQSIGSSAFKFFRNASAHWRVIADVAREQLSPKIFWGQNDHNWMLWFTFLSNLVHCWWQTIVIEGGI